MGLSVIFLLFNALSNVAPSLIQNPAPVLANEVDNVSSMTISDILEENQMLKADIKKLNDVTSSMLVQMGELADESECVFFRSHMMSATQGGGRQGSR